MPHLQQGAKVLGKKALQTGAKVAQDVLEGNNVNTALANRSKEAIRGLVPLQKETCSFVVYPRSRNQKQLCWIKTKTTFNIGRKFKWDSLARL